MGTLDFDGLNQRLLADARGLLAQWLPGGRIHGPEYVCANLKGGKGDSLSINTRTGAWADFATGDKGGDLISLFASIRGIGQGDAFRELADTTSFRPLPALPMPAKTPEVRLVPPPPGTPEPDLRAASASWTYHASDGTVLFHVARFDRDGERKSIVPYSWDGKRWVAKGWPAPRPLYGLDLLAQNPDMPVLVVEGEKACDAARQLAGHVYVCVTWPNGTAGVGSADWRPLAGRNVLLWPDADAPGLKAAHTIADRLVAQCPDVKVIDPGLQDGWDAADALAEGWDWAKVKAWAKPRAVQWTQAAVAEPAASPAEQAADAVAKGVDQAGVAPLSSGGLATLEQLGVKLSKGGQAVANQDNCLRVLENYDRLRGIAWYDEFHGKIFTHYPIGFDGPKLAQRREWRDVDTLLLVTLMQRDLELQRATQANVDAAVTCYAHQHATNEPRDWMEGLVWDGTSRLDTFLPTYMGAEDNDYTRAAGRNWWISLVARIYEPGCKVDTMLILQGEQGRYKSTAFEVIGGTWYAVATADANDPKAFGETMQGKMILELAELASFGKAEADAIKRLLTDRRDRFRAAYGRHAEDHPRRGVLVGTTNKLAVLTDETGGRRFWPVWVDRCDIEALKRDRDQLFAEAVHLYKAKATWWEMPSSTLEHQEGAREHDEIEAVIGEYLEGVVPGRGVTIQEIWTECLHFELRELQRHNQLRISRALRALGWSADNKPERRDSRVVRVWRPIKPPF